MSKVIKLSLVALLAGTVSACDVTDNSEKPAQRDVYTSLEDCVADWGDTELCERQIKEAREHAEKMAAAQAKDGGGGMAFVPLFFGPTYYGNDRYYRNSQGDYYQPTTQRARQSVGWNSTTRTPVVAPPRPPTPAFTGAPRSTSFTTTTSRPATSTTSSGSVARGGFGGSASSSSSGG